MGRRLRRALPRRTTFLASASAAGLWARARRRAKAERLRRDQSRPVARPAPPGDVRLSVVIPAYREGPRIARTVMQLKEALAELGEGEVELVIVDDGSSDDTAEQARRAGADQVIVHEENRGKGAAVRSGVLASHGRTVAFTDSDLSYPPEQLLRLLSEVESGFDVVVGSRKHIEAITLARGKRLRELSGRVFNTLTLAVLLGQYRDTQCGLKAFRSDVARVVFGRSRIEGFAFDVELFALVEHQGFSLEEVPVSLANSQTSTVRVGVDAVRMVRDVFRIRRWMRAGLYDADPAGTGPAVPQLGSP